MGNTSAAAEVSANATAITMPSPPAAIAAEPTPSVRSMPCRITSRAAYVVPLI